MGFERGVETSAVVALGRMVFLEVIAMLSLNVIDPGRRGLGRIKCGKAWLVWTWMNTERLLY